MKVREEKERGEESGFRFHVRVVNVRLFVCKIY